MTDINARLEAANALVKEFTRVRAEIRDLDVLLDALVADRQALVVAGEFERFRETKEAFSELFDTRNEYHRTLFAQPLQLGEQIRAMIVDIRSMLPDNRYCQVDYDLTTGEYTSNVYIREKFGTIEPKGGEVIRATFGKRG